MMSWLDPAPPAGDVRYRIRREHVDSRFQWTSEESDTPVPTLATLLSAETEAGRVRLTWYSSEPLGGVTVERSDGVSEWNTRGSPTDQGDGRYLFVDEGLPPGRYGYRLRIGPEETTAETWVEVAGAFRLHLEGLRPNPSPGSLRIAFGLADASSASLELVSVTGRRLLRREVGSLGAGTHTVELERPTGLSAGVYWIRLTQAGRTLTQQAVLAR
jgi:hypothetical protein